MENTKNFKGTEASSNDSTVEVLYQRLGSKWYAFSLVNDEVFFGSLSPEEISAQEAEQNAQSVTRKIPQA